MSVTTIGHAETGRLWQSRRFWEHADKGVSAAGGLLALHDAYRTARIPDDPATIAEDTGVKTVGIEAIETEAIADVPSTTEVTASALVTCVTITWADGTVTTVYPPQTPARPADATPVGWPRGIGSHLA